MGVNYNDANYSPSLSGYSGVKPFRFWCQKVLPLVYDDSLSYYELLNKVVDYLNKTIEDVANVEDNVGALNDSYNQLQSHVNKALGTFRDYINNYFDNLDVQEEINAKLDEMASSGALWDLIQPYASKEIPDLVTSWLSKNVDPVGSAVVVDSSLTIAGAAADAKVTGNKFTEITTNANPTDVIGIERTGFFVMAETGAYTQNSRYSVIAFIVGGANKVIYCAGTSQQKQAGLCFYDKNYNFISGVLGPGVAASTFDVPTNAFYAIASKTIAQADYFVLKLITNSATMFENEKTNTELTLAMTEINDTIIEGYYINPNHGAISENTNYRYHEFKVYGCGVVYYQVTRHENSAGIAFYDENGVFISGVLAKTGAQFINVPENAVICRATEHISEQNIMLKYGYSPAYFYDRITVPYFVLPNKDYATVGHEWNLYFDNVINGYDENEYSVTVRISPAINNARTYDRFLRIIPASNETGDKTITLELRRKKDYSLVETKNLTLTVKNNSTVNKKIMYIGDSLTAPGIYPAEIQYNLSSGGLVSVGTIPVTCNIGETEYTVNIEGRSGWSATDYNSNKSGNPFWDGSAFNFTYYMQNSGVQKPDIVCVGLGTNGGMNSVNDVKVIVDSIHDYDSNIKVIVSAIAPPAGQNGVGYHNKLQSASNLKNQFLLVDANYIDEYESGNNTDIATLYFNLDREFDFDTVNISVSSRNPQIITIQANNVHPSKYGYLKFADSYYNAIMGNIT